MAGQVTYLHPVCENVAAPQITQTSQQPYVVVVPINSKMQTTMLYANYKRNAARAIGALQIVMGLLLIGINVAFIRYSIYWIIGTGWWGSVLYILAGSFAIASGSHPNNCTIMTTMFFSIFSCLTLMGIITQGTIIFTFPCYSSFIYGGGTASTPGDRCNKDAAIVVSSFFIIFGVCEFVFALVQSILCCHAACCKPALQISGINQIPENQSGHSYEMHNVSLHAPEQAPNNHSVQLVMNPSSLPQQTGVTTQSGIMATKDADGATGQNAVMATGGQYEKLRDITNPPDYEKLSGTTSQLDYELYEDM